MVTVGTVKGAVCEREPVVVTAVMEGTGAWDKPLAGMRRTGVNFLPLKSRS